MSSLRRVQSSKANGAQSKGPSTQAGKARSSLNALRHGLCAKCIVLDHESRENFLTLLQQHVDHFKPANEVEFGMIEEMCASYWRQRRSWTIETALLDKQIALQSGEDGPARMAAAFDTLAALPTLPLLHRYETRLHLMYQRALRTFTILRSVKYPNDPSPISEHPPDAQTGEPPTTPATPAVPAEPAAPATPPAPPAPATPAAAAPPAPTTPAPLADSATPPASPAPATPTTPATRCARHTRHAQPAFRALQSRMSIGRRRPRLRPALTQIRSLLHYIGLSWIITRTG